MMGQFTVNTPLAVSNNTTANSPSIYPNPTNGTFTIDLGEKIDSNSIKIYDQMGREYHDFTLKNNGYSVQLIGLSKGLFIVKINAIDGFLTKTIMVE